MSGEQETIEVLYALMDKNGNYSKFAGTSICSLLENTKEKVRVHIFHDGSIRGENKNNFELLVKRYGQEIIFYNVRKLLPEVWEEAEKIKEKAVSDERYTEAALYRLLAPQILPESIGRLIYLDSDTLVHIDIKKLWREKLGKNGMAAVMEHDLLIHYGARPSGAKGELKKLLEHWKENGVSFKSAFNNGVFLEDLNVIRPMGNLLLRGLKEALDYEVDNNFYDQNIMNFYFARDAAHLPWYYNILQHWDRDLGKPVVVEGIYHYIGRSLKLEEKEPRDTLYYDYFLKTPWANGKFICKFYEKMVDYSLKCMLDKMTALRKLTSALSRKKMAVAFTLEKQAEVLKWLNAPEEFSMRVDAKADKAVIKAIMEKYGDKEAKNKEAEKEKAKEKEKEPAPLDGKAFPEGVHYCCLGSEKKLQANLSYDVDSHFYVFFVQDYIRLKMSLEQAGLEEDGNYINGNVLIDETPGLGGIVNPTKLFELI